MAGDLLERDAELATLRARLAAARDGQGGLVVLEGQAGSGKSSLVAALRDAARADGAQVLVAVGGELERDFPFGLVRQLLEPVVLARSEPERAQLLAGAAGGAAPVLGSGSSAQSGADSSFTTMHGLYWLVANLAEQTPIVLLVDDAHWGDEASLRFLDFLARRAPELPVLIVTAARPAEPGAPQALLDALAEAAGSDVVRPSPLTPAAVHDLIRRELGFDPGDSVVDAAAQATGGNPLLLRELVRTLARGGTRPTAASIRDAVPSTVVRSVARRLGRLTDTQRRTAAALALAGRHADAGLLAAMTATDVATAMSGVQALSELELVEGQPARYAHPLVRAAVSESIDVAERIALHRSAIGYLRERAPDSDELLSHVLAIPEVGEPWVVSALLDGGRRALGEGAPSAAVQRLRRALAEASALQQATAAIELELGAVLLREGETEALVHLGRACHADDDTVAAEGFRIVLGSGYYDDPVVLARLIDEAEAVSGRLEQAGRSFPADRLQAQIYAMLVQAPALTERRMQMLASPPANPPADISALLAFEACNRGESRDAVLRWIAPVLASHPLSSLERIEQPLAFYAMEPALGIDSPDGWRDPFAVAETVVRRSGSRLAAAFLDFMTADWELTVGSAASAEARARLAYDHFASYGETTLLSALRGTLISALVRRGQLAQADALAAQMLPDDELSALYSGLFAFNRRAELRMAQRRPADAIAELERLDALVRAFGWERFCQGYGRQLLARALVAVGRREEGLELARSELDRARERGIPGAEAQALISLGHGLDGDDALDALQAAAQAAESGASTWVRGLSAYELGAGLRRAGRRTDARRHLTQARELAERSDSTLLAGAAAEELLVAGGRPRRVRSSGVDALTPSERRVAEHAAAGMSNREIAETLFVTRKTVELHLGNTFGKLGIRSRTQLAGALGGAEGPETSSDS